MKRKLKIAGLILVGLIAFAPMVLAQDEAPVDAVEWAKYAALILNSVLVPLIADGLKVAWAKAPSWLKTIVPLVIGSALMMAEMWIAEKVGFAVPLDLIEQVFVGGGAGFASSIGFKFGKKA